MGHSQTEHTHWPDQTPQNCLLIENPIAIWIKMRNTTQQPLKRKMDWSNWWEGNYIRLKWVKLHKLVLTSRVKSGIFGQTAKFGQSHCLFYSSVIGIKNKSTKQTVKILMRGLIRSRLIWMSTVCKCVSEFTWWPNLPDFTLMHHTTWLGM